MFKFIRNYRENRRDELIKDVVDATIKRLLPEVRAEVKDMVIKIMNVKEMWEETDPSYSSVRAIRNIIAITNYDSATLVAKEVGHKMAKEVVSSEDFLDSIVKRIKDKQI